jgi:hypothetical protein
MIAKAPDAKLRLTRFQRVRHPRRPRATASLISRASSFLPRYSGVLPTSRPAVGTFRTDGPTFAVLLVGVILLVAGLELLPALSLGPIAEGLAR